MAVHLLPVWFCRSPVHPPPCSPASPPHSLPGRLLPPCRQLLGHAQVRPALQPLRVIPHSVPGLVVDVRKLPGQLHGVDLQGGQKLAHLGEAGGQRFRVDLKGGKKLTVGRSDNACGVAVQTSLKKRCHAAPPVPFSWRGLAVPTLPFPSLPLPHSLPPNGPRLPLISSTSYLLVCEGGPLLRKHVAGQDGAAVTDAASVLNRQ